MVRLNYITIKVLQKIILLYFIFVLTIPAQTNNPTVSNVRFQQRLDNSFKVDIYYDVTEPNNLPMIITVEASNDTGKTWTLPITKITGDVGPNITNGTNKHIIWDFAAEHANFFSEKIRIQITADNGVVEHTPCPGIPTVSYSGKMYNTVQIGNQCWLKENLDVGTMILGNQNAGDNGIVEKYCYDDEPNNCTTYGGLYQWNEAMSYSVAPGAKGICPDSWHIPNFEELKLLLNYDYGYGANALKAIGQGTGNGVGTNTSGFTALIAGYFDGSSSFLNMGDFTYFWSSLRSYNPMFGVWGVIALDLSREGSGVGFPFVSTTNRGYYIRCIKDTNTPPAVPNTPTPENNSTNVSKTTSLGWQCSDPDNDALTYDFYFSTTETPTLVASDITTATYTPASLNSNTKYYWKVAAKDGKGGITEGPVWNFTTSVDIVMNVPCPGTPTVTYADKIYNTVQIGSQCWLKENLDVGTMIQGNQNQTNNNVVEKYCYDNNPNNCAVYGGLYQWNEAMSYSVASGTKGICPNGWHIPTLAEYDKLKIVVNNDGNSLKAINQGTGTNTSGFSLLLSGRRADYDTFWETGILSYTWSSSEDDYSNSYHMYISAIQAFIGFSAPSKTQGFSIRCIKDTNIPPEVPNLPTPDNNSTNVSKTTSLGWQCSDPDNDALTYDIYFGTTETPALVTSNITITTYTPSNLNSNIKYYWKVIAKDGKGGTTEGPVWNFTITDYGNSQPCLGTPTVTYAGKVYNTVQIGNQCWLKENLDVGTMIQSSQEQTDNSVIEKYCYNNDHTNCSTYGGLYQWAEAVQYQNGATNSSGNPGFSGNIKGICPTGWHIPEYSEYMELSTLTSNDGNALKAIGQGYGSGAGTNLSGFSALLVGKRSDDGSFSGTNYSALFRSSSFYSPGQAYYMMLINSSGNIYNQGSGSKLSGFNVRCVKD